MPADAPLPSPSSSRLFHGMPARDRDAILDAGTRRTLAKGQVLIRQGEAAEHFFLIERGYLKLTQLTADGSEVIVRFVGPWDPVAGVTALGEGVYPVTATACDRVDLLDWPRSILTGLLSRFPELKTNVLREMTAHMDDALTRQELAELTGTTLFTVSRILTDWEHAGLVRSARARVEVIDAQGLRDAAEGDY